MGIDRLRSACVRAPLAAALVVVAGVASRAVRSVLHRDAIPCAPVRRGEGVPGLREVDEGDRRVPRGTPTLDRAARAVGCACSGEYDVKS